MRLFIDQYGMNWRAVSIRDLCERIGRSKARRMYNDKKDGRVVHVGYVIGNLWLTEYAVVERDSTSRKKPVTL